MGNGKQHPPPYMPYPTLKNTVETFAGSTVPTVLNRHVLSNLSGAAYSTLLSGARFLGLVDENDAPTESFNKLVQAHKTSEEEYKRVLGKILEERYEEIAQDVDMLRGTLPELEKAFRDGGITSQEMLVKSVRFYVKALEDCGVKVSPHIKKARRSRKKPKAKAKKKAKPKAEEKRQKKDGSPESGEKPPAAESNMGDQPPPKGFARLPVLGREGAFIQYPVPLTERDCQVIAGAVEYLRVLLAAQQKEDKP